MTWLLARCQQAVWVYQEWREGDVAELHDPLPSSGDAFFWLLSLWVGPVLR